MKGRNWFFDYWTLAALIVALIFSTVTSGAASIWEWVFAIFFAFVCWLALRLLELAVVRYFRKQNKKASE